MVEEMMGIRMIELADGDVLLTVKEYADIVRQHPETVRERVRTGSLRFPVEREGPRGWIRIRVPGGWLRRMQRNTANYN
jgi:hypothetical protein